MAEEKWLGAGRYGAVGKGCVEGPAARAARSLWKKSARFGRLCFAQDDSKEES